MKDTLESVRFIFFAPFLIGFLALINYMTTPGHWWVQWPALGIGIAWVFSVFHVIRTVVLVGGLAALAAVVSRTFGRKL